MSALRIGLIGNGKMGRMIDSICAQDERFAVAGFVGPGACQTLGELTDLDVALDFSYPGNVTMMLKKNYGYLRSEVLARIRADIASYIEKLAATTNGEDDKDKRLIP